MIRRWLTNLSQRCQRPSEPFEKRNTTQFSGAQVQLNLLRKIKRLATKIPRDRQPIATAVVTNHESPPTDLKQNYASHASSEVRIPTAPACPMESRATHSTRVGKTRESPYYCPDGWRGQAGRPAGRPAHLLPP